jgi:hypothetical protein
MSTFGRYVTGLFAALALIMFLGNPAAAAGTQGTVAGVVINASTGAAVAGAKLTLTGNGHSFSTASDDHGAFTFSGLDPGAWVLRTAASQYQLSTSSALSVAAGQEVDLVVQLQPVGTTNITTLATVSVKGKATLNTTSVPSVRISSSTFVAVGAQQIQSVLETTPAITIDHFNNGAPGLHAHHPRGRRQGGFFEYGL